MVTVKALENTKTRLVVEIEGSDHSVAHALKKELWNDPKVKVAGYNVAHPLVGTPSIVIETAAGKTPKKALQDAIARQKKVHDRASKEIAKAIK